MCYAPNRFSLQIAAAIFVAFALIHQFSACHVLAEAPAALQPATERLIQRLGHASYRERSLAQRQLHALVLDEATNKQTVDALKHSALSVDLEVRVAARRILRQVDFQAIESEIVSLLDIACAADKVDLPLWSHFRKLAGDDMDARRLFAKLAREHFVDLQRLSHCFIGDATRARRSTQKRSTQAVAAQTNFHQLLDPYTIANGDASAWALLFCVDDPGFRLGLGGLSTRATLALTQTGTGPTIASQSENAVIKRMIGSWIAKDRGTGMDRERLLIAMKYQCHREANRLCERIFKDRFATPSAHAMALLCASTLQRPDLEQVLMQSVTDNRTAHVWQLIASRKTKIRTQVGDVAVALMLHRRGIDPRQVGFAELQADPLVVFREHSLGFANESERREAYAKAQRLLGFP